MLWEWVNPGKQVYILDLDGTLMPSAALDDECYWQAVFSCFGVDGDTPDLHGFEHVTDSGILHEWCRARFGRAPNAKEVARIKQKFVELLETAAADQPACFEPLAGVCDWLKAVAARENVFAGIATGGWGDSARLKLGLAGLDRFDLPLASSDDDMQRTRIMQAAAWKTLGNPPPDGTVFTYVGDGVWDLEAARELGWEFIGIADGTRAVQLKQNGAVNICRDFCRTFGPYENPGKV